MDKEMQDLMDEVEGGEINENEPLGDDLEMWRKLLYRYSKEIKSYKELDAIRGEKIEEYDLKFKEIIDKVVGPYDDKLKKKREEIDRLKELIEGNLKHNSFKTKSGGYKIDQFPHIGTVSLSKEKISYVFDDEKKFIDKGFKRVVPERVELDKMAAKEYLKKCEIVNGELVDLETGEILNGVNIEYSRSFRFDAEGL
jgi:hypothetical protein